MRLRRRGFVVHGNDLGEKAASGKSECVAVPDQSGFRRASLPSAPYLLGRETPRVIDALHALKADAVDLNLGCPSPTVGKAGGGVKLMERPEEVRRIVAEARKRTELPLTAKIRLGLEDEDSLKGFCTMLKTRASICFRSTPGSKTNLLPESRGGNTLPR